jgi:hypothetical protein
MGNFAARFAFAWLFAMSLSACVSTPPTARMNAYAADRAVLVEPAEKLSCVPFARDNSKVRIFGDAWTWWDQARGRYAREEMPRSGSVLVLDGYAGPKRAHLAVVTRIISSREIRVDHANWLNDGNIYLNSPVIDVSAANDWSRVRVWNNRDGHLGVKNYDVRGFITPNEIATLPPLS